VPSARWSGAFSQRSTYSRIHRSSVCRRTARRTRSWGTESERFDVEIEYPVCSPTSFSAHCHRLQRRSPRSIAVRVGVEYWLHLRLQIQACDRLSDAVRHGGHTEDPDPMSICLWYVDFPHWRWEVTPGGHPIPEFVEVPFQVLLELFDRLLIYTSRSVIGFDPLVSLPDYPFGNCKRLVLLLRFAHRLLPTGWPPGEPEHPAPFARPALPGFIATTGRPAPVSRIGTLSLTVSSAWDSPLSDRAGCCPRPIASDGWAGVPRGQPPFSGRQVLTFHTRA